MSRRRSVVLRCNLPRFALAWLTLASMLPLAFPSEAQTSAGAVREPTPRELLNSERIERTFGSYGIDVLASDADVRVSDLYSGEGEHKVCRTFAVVRYPQRIDPRFAAEHALILAGGSIGATFAGHGWMVVKTHRYLGEIDAPPRLKALMGGIDAARLAVDVYVLDVVKDDVRLEYAAIAEVHHPDYLGLADLERIYDSAGDVPRSPDRETRDLLELVAERARQP